MLALTGNIRKSVYFSGLKATGLNTSPNSHFTRNPGFPFIGGCIPRISVCTLGPLPPSLKKESQKKVKLIPTFTLEREY